MNRREFLAASAASAAVLQQRMTAFAAPGGNIQVAIDASKIGKPVNPMIFGGYMEPATTSVWAEMLSDRKFAKPVVAAAPGAEPAEGGFFRFRGEPFRPVGPAGTVEMDTVRPFVGKHSPRVKLDGSEPRGIQQSRLRLVHGKSYEGRVYLAGDPGAKVVVRLVWGPGPGDSQSIPAPALTSAYQKFPFKFTAAADSQDARLEILGTGSGGFHVGAVSLMPADNVQGFHSGMVRLFKEEGFKMLKWPGGNFVSAYDWRDGLGDRDKRPPRLQPMWSEGIESNDVGLHDFIGLCRLVGAEPDLAIDSGFGSAREAAEEVEWLRRDAHGQDAGGERTSRALQCSYLDHRQRDVWPLAVRPYVAGSVLGETQHHRRGHEEGGPEDQGDSVRRHRLREGHRRRGEEGELLPQHLGTADS
jgi:alpha-N-arabinofuranosidase